MEACKRKFDLPVGENGYEMSLRRLMLSVVSLDVIWLFLLRQLKQNKRRANAAEKAGNKREQLSLGAFSLSLSRRDASFMRCSVEKCCANYPRISMSHLLARTPGPACKAKSVRRI
jgi:hypothetical protein